MFFLSQHRFLSTMTELVRRLVPLEEGVPGLSVLDVVTVQTWLQPHPGMATSVTDATQAPSVSLVAQVGGWFQGMSARCLSCARTLD